MKTNATTAPQPAEPSTTSAPGPELRTAKQVRHQLGDKSEPTLWRWVKDPALNFPQPSRILGRLYFRGDEIDKWIEDRMKAGRNLPPGKLTGWPQNREKTDQPEGA